MLTMGNVLRRSRRTEQSDRDDQNQRGVKTLFRVAKRSLKRLLGWAGRKIECVGRALSVRRKEKSCSRGRKDCPTRPRCSTGARKIIVSEGLWIPRLEA